MFPAWRRAVKFCGLLVLGFSLPGSLLADSPLVSGNYGTQARFIDDARTSILVPAGSSDTFICDPDILDVVASSGFGSGRNCLRFSNNSADGSNYLPFTANSIISFVNYYLRDLDREVCEVSSNPWSGWVGKPEAQCGAQAFTQTNTCVTPPFGCNDTCPWAPNGQYQIKREITVAEGACCDSETYMSETGLTERQTRGSCFAPGTIDFTETNQCGDVRKKTLACMRCNSKAWTPESGVSSSEAASSCLKGNVFEHRLVNECGGIKRNIIACTGCDGSVWRSASGVSLQVAAKKCPVGEVFQIINDCGMKDTAPCVGS
jgi:hypothetical protein